MIKATGPELRQRFLDFFARHGHQVVASSSLVPAGDPTLLFTNAGMVQFKDVFLGREKRPYTRATTAQKCVRAGGKHNDLDSVGRTARHNTFFEMLGNFSFGDYFKRDAIRYAWEFLTGEVGLDPDRLWVTVYRDDDEAARIWHEEVGVPAERIVRLGEKDNFWSMGDTGPCGPCSEIIYDRGVEHRCDAPVCAIGACDCDRWRELWNLVFMQYDRDAAGNLTPLPRPSIDTGMGLERITSIIEGTESIYETDLLRPIVSAVERLSGVKYRDFPDPSGFPFRVIADHIRSVSFIIADGVVPSNEGRGYVLRRILRRASRFGQKLGLREPFMHTLVPVVADLMKDAYPELAANQDYVRDVIRREEERFAATLSEGMARADQVVARVEAAGGDTIPGEDVFMLYDTYGFPIDIMEDMAIEHNLRLDHEGFARAMEAQRQRARAARAGGGAFTEPAMPANLPPTVFVGYETTRTQARVLRIWAPETGEDIPQAEAGSTVLALLDVTPFYAESGGQVADTGHVAGPRGRAVVEDVHKTRGGHIWHELTVVEGVISPGETVSCEVDGDRRAATARNHTATHLLHAALRRVLGEHVHQAGSLVAPDRLRFDFTHPDPVSAEQLAQVEDLVAEIVLQNLPVETVETSYEQGRAMGAMALFDEKYGERVRVVKVGDFSLELCGGTHVRRTGDIGLVMITSESSVGAGLRRIEAVSGQGTLQFARGLERTLSSAGSVLRAGPGDLVTRLRELQESLRAKDNEIAALRERLWQNEAAGIVAGAERVDGVAVVGAQTTAGSPEALRRLADFVRSLAGSAVVILAGSDQERVNFLCAVTPDLVKRGVHAGQIVRVVAEAAGGQGGGRPDLAQAGARDAGRAQAALAAGVEFVRTMLTQGNL